MAVEMAVTVVVSPLLGAVFDKLSSPILKTFGSIYGIKDDLEKLSSSLSRIRAVLLDAEMKQITDAATRDWLGKLKDAAYEADDIIDECATKALFFLDSGINLGSSSSSSTQVGNSFLSYFNSLSLRYKIAKRIKKIVTKFDGIAAEKDKFQLREGVLESSSVKFMQQRETSSGLFEPVVYGRGGETKKFVRTLLSNANGENNLRVYPVVGVGGLGKTTFAQLIYEDESIVEAFPTRIWVCVSEDFSVKILTKKIIARLSGIECGLEDLDPLQNHLKQLLNGKKYLLVLDDVWNEDPEIWERLRSSLECGAYGSSVVVTTRLPTVAKIMGTCSMDDLTTLSDEDCWALFRGRAFGMEDEAVENLEAIGKQIVKKCGGVPLVAKALGGSLRFERDASMWESVRDDIWKLEREKGTILPCLRLSYNCLPSYLRECFVYCCVFPKDYEMVVEELIQLWMANGLLQSDGSMELEEVGNRIFNQLVLRSFLQDVSVNIFGKQVCKMHDLMHELACSVARKECHAWEVHEELVTIPKSVRHLWIDRIPFIRVKTQLESPLPLRTCIFSGGFYMYDHPSFEITFKNLTCLRALQFEAPLTLPQSIEKMLHLRYLNLSLSLFEHLPKSICSQKNLQTLNLHFCRKLNNLPESLNKLINLRHLDLSKCGSLTQLPDGIGGLINLRHLDLSKCGSLTQLPNGIGGLINLRHLDLSWCGSLTQLPDAVEGLINLRYMDLSSCIGLIQLPQRIGELSNLRHLNLSECCTLIQMPIGIGKLSCLETLEMFVVGPEDSGADITELQGLNHLRGYLEIQGLEHVRNGAEAKQANLTAKQKLSSLKLQWRRDICSNSEDVIQGLQPCHESLKDLTISEYRGSVFPSWIQNLEKLVEIKLQGCSKCEELPPLGHLPLLKKLQISGMYYLKRINKEFYGITSNSEAGGVFFPSLEYIWFRDMRNWEEWESLDHHQQVFPCLKNLTITNCPKLPSLPFSILHSVQELTVFGGCEKLVVRSLPCIRHLELDNVSSIPVGSLQNLDALQSLKLRSFEFTSMPQHIHNLTSLKSLEISFCDSLTSLSQYLDSLSSLNTLSIKYCPSLELSSGDFHGLLALQSLFLMGLPKLRSLPDLQHLPNLQSLDIHICSNLRVLPQWMQNLTSLHTLKITGCHPDIVLKCEKDKGEYWPYISHIPHLDIR